MKTYQKYLLIAATTVVCVANFAACSKDDGSVDGQPDNTVNQVYTMTIEASKGDDVNIQKALSLSGSTLNATWATSEQIYVTNGSTSLGTLSPDADGETATLSGTLSGSININDQLTLTYPRTTVDYSGQKGTLNDIAANYDYATATATVTAVNNGKITADAVTFVNQQAIVKFTLKDKNGNSLNASSLRINARNSSSKTDLTIKPTSATNEIFVALPAATSLWLIATVGSETYIYEKANVNFINGKYYAVTVKMAKPDHTSFSVGTVIKEGETVYASSSIYAKYGPTNSTMVFSNLGVYKLVVANGNYKWQTSNGNPVDIKISKTSSTDGIYVTSGSGKSSKNRCSFAAHNK